MPHAQEKTADAEQRVLDSALALFSEKGYNGTSVREIIGKAGVTRPVLYYYFENKEGLFCRVVQSQFRQLTDDATAAVQATSDCAERLTLLIRKMFERAEAAPEIVRLLLQVFFSPPAEGPCIDRIGLAFERFDLIVSIMRDGIDSGQLAGDAPEPLALSFAGIMDMYVMARIHDPEMQLTPELGERLVSLFLNGARAKSCR